MTHCQLLVNNKTTVICHCTTELCSNMVCILHWPSATSSHDCVQNLEKTFIHAKRQAQKKLLNQT